MTDEIRINPISPIPEQFPRKPLEKEVAGKSEKEPKPEAPAEDTISLLDEAQRELERLENESK